METSRSEGSQPLPTHPTILSCVSSVRTRSLNPPLLLTPPVTTATLSTTNLVPFLHSALSGRRQSKQQGGPRKSTTSQRLKINFNGPKTTIATFHTISADRRCRHRDIEEVPAPPPIKHPLNFDDISQDHNNHLPFRNLIENEVAAEFASAPCARRYVSLVSNIIILMSKIHAFTYIYSLLLGRTTETVVPHVPLGIP